MLLVYLRTAAAFALIGLLGLAVGCAGAGGPASVPTSGPKPPPNQSQAQQSSIPLAKVQSVTPAKAISPAGGPRLALDTERVEFGNVPYESVVAYSFNVKNVGSESVFLGLPYIRVKEGC